MKSMKVWQLMLGPLQLSESSASWFARGAPTWVGMWPLVLDWPQLSSALEVAWGVGFDVVVGVDPIVIDEGGNVGGCIEHVGVGGIGEGCVVDVEGGHVGGCPSSIGVFGRWGGGVGVGRSCRRSRRFDVWELLWHWECGCLFWVRHGCRRGQRQRLNGDYWRRLGCGGRCGAGRFRRRRETSKVV